jgi:hypothetical protein
VLQKVEDVWADDEQGGDLQVNKSSGRTTDKEQACEGGTGTSTKGGDGRCARC